jgi:hypothetical protein
VYVPKKTCYKCREVKPVTEFYRRSGAKSQYRNICRGCADSAVRVYRKTPEARKKSREKARIWRADPANVAHDAKLRKVRNQLSPRTAMRLMIFNARKRANVLVTLDELFALWERQDRRCAITGIIMTWGRGKIEATSLSLDRIDPDRDYELKNIRFVCHAVNCFRGRMSDEEMVEMARIIIAKADAQAAEAKAA